MVLSTVYGDGHHAFMSTIQIPCLGGAGGVGMTHRVVQTARQVWVFVGRASAPSASHAGAAGQLGKVASPETRWMAVASW